MESDKIIVVRETVGDQTEVVIIDVANPKDLLRCPISADSALMNPSKKLIALKCESPVRAPSHPAPALSATTLLQIFDLESKATLKTHQMEEDIIFWKWINADTIGIVTDTSVFHWALGGERLRARPTHARPSGTSPPAKMFERDPTLAGTKIVNYRSDADGKFLLLLGIAAKVCAATWQLTAQRIVQERRVVGAMQLYSTERKVSQPIEGHAACFTQYKMEGNPHASNLLCYSVCDPELGVGSYAPITQ